MDSFTWLYKLVYIINSKFTFPCFSRTRFNYYICSDKHETKVKNCVCTQILEFFVLYLILARKFNELLQPIFLLNIKY